MDHHAIHNFRALSCLCANKFITGHKYTECAVYMALGNKYNGKYVAGCAFDCCIYLGKCLKT